MKLTGHPIFGQAGGSGPVSGRGGSVRCPGCGWWSEASVACCPRCGLAPERIGGRPPARPKRRLLADLALAAAAAAVLIFAVRTFGTLRVVSAPATVRLCVVLSFLAHCANAVFLVVFEREYARRLGANVRTGARVLLGTWVAAVLVAGVELVGGFGWSVLDRETTAAVRTVVSLVVACGALVFFTALCGRFAVARGRLARAVRYAVAGSLVAVVARAAAFALYATGLMRPDLVPLQSPVLRAVAIAVSGFVTVTMLGFLLALHAALAPGGEPEPDSTADSCQPSVGSGGAAEL